MTADATPIVEVHHLAVDIDGHPVLWDIDFSIAAGAFLGIIGPNGAGKTTLLRVLLGLVPPARGAVTVLGRSPSQLGRGAHQIGYVPQRPDFDPRFPVSVQDVVMMGRACCLGLFRFPRRDDWRKVQESIRQVGLAGAESRRIGELSGGEQQRAFLARALCSETRLLLLDEATTGLDLPAQHELYALLQRLRRDLNLTIIAVSHDLLELGAHADELICINGTTHIHGRPQAVLHSHQLREAYRCEFDFLSDEARESAGRH
ncbi:MAG TPA: ABC transporter ATP-binding protein [Candidatus Acidoferrales bacterium]|nr:ABC transporter ATP-binding protein [Candidatus Acidoferrales bacterium]